MAPLAQAPLPPATSTDEEEPPTLIKTSIFSVIEDDSDPVEDEADLPAAAVIPKPVSRPRAPSKPVQAAAPQHEAGEDMEPEEELLPLTPAPRPKPALAAVGASIDSLLQPTLNLHQDEVARFKGTDKTIIEGEDLDVPTWMRMRQKTRR